MGPQVLADAKRESLSHLLRELHVLIAQTSFSSSGCHALSTCANQLTVSALHKGAALLLEVPVKPYALISNVILMQEKFQELGLTQWVMVEDWLCHVNHVLRMFSGRFARLWMIT